MPATRPHLRGPKAVPMGLVRVPSRECARWRRQGRPYPARDTVEAETAALADEQPLADELLAQLKDEQVLREAILTMPPRCRELIGMLFFDTPARPYQEIARRLGLAPGSIGFIPGPCLTRPRLQPE